MEIKEGMYVRTDEGIRKILFEYDGGYELNKSLHYLYSEGHDLYKEDLEDEVLKSSYNIIDLIEVGDYVNGEIVTKISLDNIECNYIETGYSYNRKGLRSKDIKSIVTKEQFEQMKYEVE